MKKPGKAKPTLRYDFYLDEIGYEVQVFLDGKYAGFECRDFAGDHKVKDLILDLNNRVKKLVKQFRESH